MKSKMIKYYIISFVAFFTFLSACSTGVEDSPMPGILRISLKAADMDTSIVIIDENYSVDTSSVFNLIISEGKAYQGDNYSILYENVRQFYNPGNTYNILSRDNQEFEVFKIFESYVPPGKYNKIQFAMNATSLKIGDYASIPVELPKDKTPILDFMEEFEVKENSTTEVLIEIEPLSSIVRYRDTYLFNRKVSIKNISNR